MCIALKTIVGPVQSRIDIIMISERAVESFYCFAPDSILNLRTKRKL